MEEYLKLEEVMAILKLSKKTLIRYIKAKKLKAFHVGLSYRIPKSSIEEYVTNHLEN